jgi:hypothetical protein
LKKTFKYCSDILVKIRQLSFINGNSPQVNLIILLGALTFIIIGIDLDSDFAIKNHEIDRVIAVMQHVSTGTTFLDCNFLLVEPPVIGIIISLDTSIISYDVLNLPRDRSPPQASA